MAVHPYIVEAFGEGLKGAPNGHYFSSAAWEAHEAGAYLNRVMGYGPDDGLAPLNNRTTALRITLTGGRIALIRLAYGKGSAPHRVTMEAVAA